MNKKNKKINIVKMLTVLLLLCISFTSACADTQMNASGSKDVEKDEFVPVVVSSIQAEDATVNGDVKINTSRSGYTGSGYVSLAQGENDCISFEIGIDKKGFYNLVFIAASDGYKENYCTVDGIQVGNLVTENGEFNRCIVKRVYLEKGTHEVVITPYWGYTDIDELIIETCEELGEEVYNITPHLNNKSASKNTKRLMSYLTDNYGQNIIAGQYSEGGQFGRDFQVINNVTGDYPAMIGLDFIDYTPSRVANGTVGKSTEYGKTFWENGGIVTYCWHWNAPEKYITGIWYSAFYTEHTNIDIEKIMNGEDPEGYDLLMRDIDAIAEELKVLKDADVPVLWRPLHEASGGWFWWGAKGPDAYKKLYILLYDRLTNEYGLNNLIWVWNGQDKEWYPGDEYVDIIGWDIYPGKHKYGSQVNTYIDALNCASEPKMVVLSENGCVPDPELCIRDGAMWGYIGTWQGEFVAKDTALYSYSEEYTDKDALIKFYSDEHVISLGDLPDLKKYEIRKELK